MLFFFFQAATSQVQLVQPSNLLRAITMAEGIFLGSAYVQLWFTKARRSLFDVLAWGEERLRLPRDMT